MRVGVIACKRVGTGPNNDGINVEVARTRDDPAGEAERPVLQFVPEISGLCAAERPALTRHEALGVVREEEGVVIHLKPQFGKGENPPPKNSVDGIARA